MGTGSSRLYVALYVQDQNRAGPQSLGWGLIVCPEIKSSDKALKAGTFYSVMTGNVTSFDFPSTLIPNVIVRVLIAKVTRPKGPLSAQALLEGVPVGRGNPGGGKLWVSEAVRALGTTRILDAKAKETGWPYVELTCLNFLGKKQGVDRWRTSQGEEKGRSDKEAVPTYDLLRGKEVVA